MYFYIVFGFAPFRKPLPSARWLTQIYRKPGAFFLSVRLFFLSLGLFFRAAALFCRGGAEKKTAAGGKLPPAAAVIAKIIHLGPESKSVFAIFNTY